METTPVTAPKTASETSGPPAFPSENTTIITAAEKAEKMEEMRDKYFPLMSLPEFTQHQINLLRTIVYHRLAVQRARQLVDREEP